MAANVLVERDQIVNDLRGAIRDGQSGLKYVPRLLVKVIDTDAWEKRYDSKARESVSFTSFLEFVTADPTAGLGASADLIQRIVKGTEAEKPVGRLLKGEIERAADYGTNRHTSRESTTLSRPRDAAALTARLKRDDPALAEKVVNGEMSAYAAARVKGWKPPRIQVTTPERTAVHLRKYMTRDDLALLAKLLAED